MANDQALSGDETFDATAFVDDISRLQDENRRLRWENVCLRLLMDAYGHWEASDAWGQAEAARLLHNAYVDALHATGRTGKVTDGDGAGHGEG